MKKNSFLALLDSHHRWIGVLLSMAVLFVVQSCDVKTRDLTDPNSTTKLTLKEVDALQPRLAADFAEEKDRLLVQISSLERRYASKTEALELMRKDLAEKLSRREAILSALSGLSQSVPGVGWPLGAFNAALAGLGAATLGVSAVKKFSKA
jgi:hypothetical protein